MRWEVEPNGQLNQQPVPHQKIQVVQGDNLQENLYKRHPMLEGEGVEMDRGQNDLHLDPLKENDRGGGNGNGNGGDDGGDDGDDDDEEEDEDDEDTDTVTESENGEDPNAPGGGHVPGAPGGGDGGDGPPPNLMVGNVGSR